MADCSSRKSHSRTSGTLVPINSLSNSRRGSPPRNKRRLISKSACFISSIDSSYSRAPRGECGTEAGRRMQMSQALEGIRVIDFTHDQAGPSCTQMLAWLGADVIKIERPPHGDRARRLWNMDNPDLDSFFFLLLNSNKRSTVVNLRTEEGKEIARRLIRDADSDAENLGPGVSER